MPAIAVSVLHHGDAAPTIAAVESLLADLREAADPAGVELTILVADNGPAGPQREALREGMGELPGVRLVFNERNLGFAAGHNRNIAALLGDGDPDFLWLLNNDCRIRPGGIAALLACAQRRPEVGIWGATLLEADGRTLQCAGVCFYNPWLGIVRPLGAGRPRTDRERQDPSRAAYVAGASLFFPIRTLREGLEPPPGPAARGRRDAAWLNEEFFLYCEELDLARRLREPLDLGWCREAEIIHDGGLAAGTTGGVRTPESEYHSVLSALKFTSLHHPRKLWCLAPTLFAAKHLRLGFGAQRSLLGPVRQAFRDFRAWRRGMEP
jgi:GT2 family glycosyltransferase